MTMLRRIALSTLLAVGLVACGDGETDGSTQQAAIAPIAAPAGQSWVDTATETPEGGILLGNPNAPIKLMEYGSLTCPACAAESASRAATSGRASGTWSRTSATCRARTSRTCCDSSGA